MSSVWVCMSSVNIMISSSSSGPDYAKSYQRRFGTTALTSGKATRFRFHVSQPLTIGMVRAEEPSRGLRPLSIYRIREMID